MNLRSSIVRIVRTIHKTEWEDAQSAHVPHLPSGDDAEETLVEDQDTSDKSLDMPTQDDYTLVNEDASTVALDVEKPARARQEEIVNAHEDSRPWETCFEVLSEFIGRNSTANDSNSDEFCSTDDMSEWIVEVFENSLNTSTDVDQDPCVSLTKMEFVALFSSYNVVANTVIAGGKTPPLTAFEGHVGIGNTRDTPTRFRFRCKFCLFATIDPGLNRRHLASCTARPDSDPSQPQPSSKIPLSICQLSKRYMRQDLHIGGDNREAYLASCFHPGGAMSEEGRAWKRNDLFQVHYLGNPLF